MGVEGPDLRTIFNRALERESPAARAKYLDEVCEGDRDLRERVEALLSAHGQAGNFLGGDADDSGPAADMQTCLDLDLEGEFSAPLGTLGDYTIRRQIGRGGMGVVYEAWQSSVERSVALKILPGAVAADDKAFHRFMREARAAAKLHHPNIVGVYGMGQEENTPYYAMEHVRGETLALVLARIKESEDNTETSFGTSSEPQSYLNLANAFADVSDGLQHAHSKGVVHRDIKPANLILDSEGRLRVLDFGLARLEGQDSLTRTGDLMGTPLYMSPEQAKAQRIPIDHRTDIYSLGATIYETLTGRPPFEGRDHQDTLSRILFEEPRAPQTINPRVPTDLQTIVLKCLRKDRDDRYATAEALGQDLRRFGRGDPVEARPLSQWLRILRNLRRHRLRIGVASMVMLLLVFAALWSIGLYQKRREAREDVYMAIVRDASADVSNGKYIGRVGGGLVSGLQERGMFRNFDVPARLRDAASRLAEARELLPERPEAPYLKARALFFLGDAERALEIGKQVARANPHFLPAWVLVVRILDRRGSAEAAREFLARAPAVWSAWMEDWRQAEGALFRSKWQEAVLAINRTLSLLTDPREEYGELRFDLLVGRGIANIELGRYEEAQRDLLEARFSRPASLVPPLLVGQIYIAQGKLEVADGWFEECFERTDWTDEAASLFAEAFTGLGFDNPDYVVKWARRRPPGRDRDHMLMWWLCCAGQPAEALEIAARLQKSDPHDRVTAALKIRVHGESGDHREMYRMFQKCWLEPPARSDGLFLCGLQFRLAGHGAESELLFREHLRTHGHRIYLDANLGCCLMDQGRPDLAEHWVERAVAENPLEHAANFILADLSSSRGDYTEAIALATEVAEADASVLAHHLALAATYRASGDDDRAFEECREIVRRGRPGSRLASIAWSGLAQIHASRGEFEKAIAAYVESLTCPWGSWLSPWPEVRGHDPLAEIFRLAEREPHLEGLDKLNAVVPILRKHMKRLPEHPRLLAAAAVLSTLAPDLRDLKAAREFARRAVDVAPFYFEAHEILARIERRSGDLPAAICTLERLSRLSEASQLTELLRDYRSELNPDLASFASLDGVYGEPHVETDGASGVALDDRWVRSILPPASEDLKRATTEAIGPVWDRFARFAGLERNERRASLLSYLRGRLAQDSGQLETAIQAFDAAARFRSGGPEALLRLTQCLVASGDPVAAESRLHEELVAEGHRARADVLWKVWAAVHFVHLRSSAETVLERFPAVDVRVERRYSTELRWVLRALRDERGVRINCGASFDDRDSQGRVWTRDQFYRGAAFKSATTGPDPSEEPLPTPSWCERRFRGEIGEYEIPIPSGRYAAVLGFAASSWEREEPRTLDIEVEASTPIYGFSPREDRGPAPQQHVENVKVTDGALSIRLTRKAGRLAISSIEIHRLD